MKKLKVTNDFVFKKIFGDEKNKEILKNLLISILEIPIEKIEILNNMHLGKEREEDKEGILDIKATLNNNINVNIEMQVRNKYNMIDRSLFYWAKLHSQSINRGEIYNSKNRTIAINILGYNIFKEGPYHETCFIKREYNNEILTKDLEMHFIQIPKCRNEKIKNSLDLWVRFIGNIKERGKGEMERIISKETIEAIEKAQKVLDDLTADPEIRRYLELKDKWERDELSYLKSATEKARLKGEKEGKAKGMAEGKKEGRAEGIAEGIAEGRAEGIAEGKIQEKIEIAKKLKKENIPNAIIIKTTGLTKEDIEKI